MPPPRRPRDRLARLLRATADRLATAAATPPRTLPLEPPPRRPGEPPEHWLRLVAAHAPGLLHPAPTPAFPVDQEVWVVSDASTDANLLIDEEMAGGRGGDAGGRGTRRLPLRPAVPGVVGRGGGAAGLFGTRDGAGGGRVSGARWGLRRRGGTAGRAGFGTSDAGWAWYRSGPGDSATGSAPWAGDGVSGRADERIRGRAASSDGTGGWASFSGDGAARHGPDRRGEADGRWPLDAGWGTGGSESAAHGEGQRGAPGRDRGPAGRRPFLDPRGDPSSHDAGRGGSWGDGLAPAGSSFQAAGPHQSRGGPGAPGALAGAASSPTDARTGSTLGQAGTAAGPTPGRTGAPAGPTSGRPFAPAGSTPGWTGAPAGPTSVRTAARSAPAVAGSAPSRAGVPSGSPSAGTGARTEGDRSGWDVAADSEPGTASRAPSPSDAGAPTSAAPLTGRNRNGRPVDAPGIGTGGTTTAGGRDLRVHLLSLGRQQTHPNPIAPAAQTGAGADGWPLPGRPHWTGTVAGPWPELPAEAGERIGDGAVGSAHDAAAGSLRRDPWPALPDDRALWAPVVTAGDADRLARLDREQAGD